MEVKNDQKTGLSNAFREHVLDMMVMKLTEWIKDSRKSLNRIREAAAKFESATFAKATSKDDYVAKIKEKMRLAKRTYGDRGAPNNIGNQQMMGKMVEKQVANSNQIPQQNLSIGCSSDQNLISFPAPQIEGLHQTSVQQNMQMQEPYLTTNEVSDMQWSYQAPLVTGTVVKQEQVGIKEISRTSIAGDYKPIPQLQVPSCTNSQSIPVHDVKMTCEAERKILMNKYDYARRVQMPILMKVQKLAEEGSCKFPSATDREKWQEMKIRVELLIQFLKWKETALNCLSNQALCRHLNAVAQYVNWYCYKGIVSSQNQAAQSSNGQTSVNHLQAAPVISSKTKKVVRNSQTNTLNLQSTAASARPNAPNVKLSTLSAPDMHHQTIECQSVNQTSEPMKLPSTDQLYKRLQLRNPQKVSEKEELMDSVFLPRSKANSKKAQSQLSRGSPSSYKQSVSQKSNTSILDPGTFSEHKYSVDDSISTLRKPCKEVEIPANFGLTTDKHDIGVRKPETLASSMSDFSDQSNQLPQSLVLLFERLTQAVLSIPSEVLKSAMEDISSAFVEMDELPKFAFHEKYNLSVNELGVFHQQMNTSTGDECMPCKRLKRDFDLTSKDVPTSEPCDSCMEKPRKAANQDLVVAEVININQKLIETWIEVTPSLKSYSEEGTIVRCLYMPIAFGDDLIRHFAYMVPLSILTVEFLVPSHYPEVSPIILDNNRLPDGCSLEGELLLVRAREMFDRSIRSLVSIAEMAKAWDDCGRMIFTELAQRLGGKSFNDRLGIWRKNSAN